MDSLRMTLFVEDQHVILRCNVETLNEESDLHFTAEDAIRVGSDLIRAGRLILSQQVEGH